MHRGYIKLWRKMFDSGIQKDHATFALWIWILCNVTRKPLNYITRGQQIKLEPGEMIIGRRKISVELRLGEQSVRSALKKLKNWKNLTIKSTNRYSIIKVVNWELYQENDFDSNQQTVTQLTSKPPTDPPQTTTKQEVRSKNVKKRDRESGNGIPVWIKKETWDDFKEYRIRKKAPLTDRAVKGIIRELEKLKEQGNDPDAVIEQSIVRGWTGVFPLKSNRDDCPGFDWSKP